MQQRVGWAHDFTTNQVKRKDRRREGRAKQMWQWNLASAGRAQWRTTPGTVEQARARGLGIRSRRAGLSRAARVPSLPLHGHMAISDDGTTFRRPSGVLFEAVLFQADTLKTRAPSARTGHRRSRAMGTPLKTSSAISIMMRAMMMISSRWAVRTSSWEEMESRRSLTMSNRLLSTWRGGRGGAELETSPTHNFQNRKGGSLGAHRRVCPRCTTSGLG